MYQNPGKNPENLNKDLKKRQLLIVKFNQWLATLGQLLNTEQQSHYK